MYEAVHAMPDGRSTVTRYALTAKRYGFDGIVVRNHPEGRSDDDRLRSGPSTDIDVVWGVEIRADDPERAGGYLGEFRRRYPLVLLHGGGNRLNRFAVEQERIDVLAHPMAEGGDFNHVLAREAARNGVRIEFAFEPVLRSTGGQRVKAIADLRKLREIVLKYEVPYVVSAVPTSHLHLRAPRELMAVGELIGFSAEEIRDGLEEWGRLADRNRERFDESFIEPGVNRGRYRSDGGRSTYVNRSGPILRRLEHG